MEVTVSLLTGGSELVSDFFFMLTIDSVSKDRSLTVNNLLDLDVTRKGLMTAR